MALLGLIPQPVELYPLLLRPHQAADILSLASEAAPLVESLFFVPAFTLELILQRRLKRIDNLANIFGKELRGLLGRLVDLCLGGR